MLDYLKKRAIKTELTLLNYVGAFGEGLSGKHSRTYRDGCPKLFRAYKDGVRVRERKVLTASKVGDSIRGDETNLN